MTIDSTIERLSSVKTESLSSSEMMESREVVSDQSKVLLESEEEERALLPRGMELDCSSCLLQEQMKEGNYELVSKVAKHFTFHEYLSLSYMLIKLSSINWSCLNEQGRKSSGASGEEVCAENPETKRCQGRSIKH